MLYFRGAQVKHICRSVPNQKAMLNVFESAGWPYHLRDPLTPQGGLVASDRLHDAVIRLNHDLAPPLRFARDGAAKFEKVETGFTGFPG